MAANHIVHSLLRVARRAKATADSELLDAVQAAINEGVPYAEIAEHAGISTRTVSRWKGKAQ